MKGRRMPFFVRNFGKMMDAEFGLTALLALGNGEIAVQRFELSPNGHVYGMHKIFHPVNCYIYTELNVSIFLS